MVGEVLAHDDAIAALASLVDVELATMKVAEVASAPLKQHPAAGLDAALTLPVG